MRAGLNETETGKTVVRISKTKSWFFEKFSRIDRPLTRLENKKMRQNEAF